jgi:hypothetical protein
MLMAYDGRRCAEERPSVDPVDTALRAARRELATSIRQPDVTEMAAQLAGALKERLGHMWQVGSGAVGKTWSDVESDVESRGLTGQAAAKVTDAFLKQRRALLHHMAALLDVNECGLEWLAQSERAGYVTELQRAIIIDKCELDAAVGVPAPDVRRRMVFEVQLENVTRLLQEELLQQDRRLPAEALSWWARASRDQSSTAFADTLPFRTVARALLAMQASSASVERLFSHAGNTEANKRHNLNTHNLEMMLVIRKWALSRIATDALPPPDLSHATLLTDTAQQVNQMCDYISCKVWDKLKPR